MLEKTASRSTGAAEAGVFRAVFESSVRPLLLMAADAPRFTMVAANEAHARTFHTTREALEGRGVLEVFPANPPAGVARFMDQIRGSLERVMASALPDQMPIGRLDVIAETGERVDRYWTATNTPILGTDGAVTHIVSATQDVTGDVHARRSERARTLLMREVDHRARNSLAVVQSLVRLSSAASLEQFRSILDGRIESLARAQTSLAARKWEGALLGDIVAETLAAIAPADRCRAEGPRILLAPDDVQALSMILHELATNAVKYGSLARPRGALSVNWSRQPGRTAQIVWREDGGAGVEAPAAGGFGTRLIAQLVHQLSGELRYDWRTDGLTAELTFPIRTETA